MSDKEQIIAMLEKIGRKRVPVRGLRNNNYAVVHDEGEWIRTVDEGYATTDLFFDEEGNLEEWICFV